MYREQTSWFTENDCSINFLKNSNSISFDIPLKKSYFRNGGKKIWWECTLKRPEYPNVDKSVISKINKDLEKSQKQPSLHSRAIIIDLQWKNN